MADQPEPGAELIIQHREKRFTRKAARVTRRLKLDGVMDMEEELPDGDAHGELHGDQFIVAERVAATRPGGAIQIGKVIVRHIACDILERPVSPPVMMPAPPTPQRAGLSKLNAYMPPFRRRVELSDKKEPEGAVWPPRRPHMEFDDWDYRQVKDAESEPQRLRKSTRRRENLFINPEACVDGDASGNKVTDDEKDDLDKFIVADNVKY